jgi:hypothetical protein
LEALEASGISNSDILSEIEDIEGLLSSQVEEDLTPEHWSHMKNKGGE